MSGDLSPPAVSARSRARYLRRGRALCYPASRPPALLRWLTVAVNALSIRFDILLEALQIVPDTPLWAREQRGECLTGGAGRRIVAQGDRNPGLVRTQLLESHLSAGRNRAVVFAVPSNALIFFE